MTSPEARTVPGTRVGRDYHSDGRVDRGRLGDGLRFTFLRDRAALLSRNQIGVDLLLWSSDYPHNGSTWPKTREVLGTLEEN